MPPPGNKKQETPAAEVKWLGTASSWSASHHERRSNLVMKLIVARKRGKDVEKQVSITAGVPWPLHCPSSEASKRVLSSMNNGSH